MSRYTVISPDRAIHTNHRTLAGVCKRVNFLLNRGHHDIDFSYSPAPGFERHIQLNERVEPATLKLRLFEESRRNGFQTQLEDLP